jgi:branched-subunit amino acid aminotransferase/4-amino-4-deoxychorismate lyase
MGFSSHIDRTTAPPNVPEAPVTRIARCIDRSLSLQAAKSTFYAAFKQPYLHNIMKIWLNGELLAENTAQTGAHNAGNLLGWGVFSTLAIAGKRPLWIERHLHRLRHDAAQLALEFTWTDDELREALNAVVHANAVDSGLARITITGRGDGRWNHTLGADVSLLAQTMNPPQRNDLSLGLSSHRLEARRPLAGIKSTSYAAHHWLWLEAQSLGVDEGLVLNQNDEVCEAARSNVFWARGETLFTPAVTSGCLPGIGRDLVLQWARENAVDCREGHFSLEELLSAGEIFLTNATNGPRGVAHLVLQNTSGGNHRLPSPGKFTRRFQELWDLAGEGI